MKKTLIALAVLGTASSFAMAASNVTLYGKITESVLASKVQGQDSTVGLKSGFDAGSRWGIKGSEDLGNGYSVGFQLEQGFNSDMGTNSNDSRQFHRQSTLHVKGGFGTLAVGRMGALTSGTGSYSLAGSNIDPMGYGYVTIGAANTNAFVDTSRLNNAVVYVSPEFSGWKVSAQYSNGTDTDDTGAKWNKNNHYYGIGAAYNANALQALVAFEMLDNRGATPAAYAAKIEEKVGDIKLTQAEKAAVYDKKVYIATIGGSYDFGTVKTYVGYQYAKQEDVRKQQGVLLGLSAPAAGGKVLFSAKYLKGELEGLALADAAAPNDKDFNLWSVAAAYEYPLSKRTKVWGFGGYADGGDAYETTKGVKAVNNVSGSLKVGEANVNGWALGVGIQHNF